MKSKSRRCSTCRKKVDAEAALMGSLRAFCSYDCMKLFVDSKSGKEAVRKIRVKEAREARAKSREKLKTAGEYKKEAQAAFNRYIRIRDMHKGCISCGEFFNLDVYGGGFDAGHFRSRGSASHLAFDTRNCHAQCKRCNRYLSGNVTEYRSRLIERIGIESVEALEADNVPRKFSIDYLKRVKKIFNKRAQVIENIRKVQEEGW